MTTTINASLSNGIVQTADGSGVMKLQSNGVTTNALAWVSIAGSASPTIRSSYNVSSITRNGAGDYTITFTAALADANYSAVVTNSLNAATGYTYPQVFSSGSAATAPTTSSFRVGTNSNTDPVYMNAIVFGN